MRNTAKGQRSTRPSCRHTAFTDDGWPAAPLSGEQGEEPVTNTSEHFRVAKVLRGCGCVASPSRVSNGLCQKKLTGRGDLRGIGRFQLRSPGFLRAPFPTVHE